MLIACSSGRSTFFSTAPNAGTPIGKFRYSVFSGYVVVYALDEQNRRVNVVLVSEGHRDWRKLLKERPDPMIRPIHTPYDGSATPFTIGVKQLDLADWIEVDDGLDRCLDEKERLWLADRETVFAETETSRAAQAEVLAMLVAYLPERFPTIYRADGECMQVGERLVDLSDATMPPLFRAARLVQEDLVIMQRAADGWRLTAASLSFPSSWSLAEKFDRPMQAIHADVPDFEPGTRNALLIDRMFDNLRADRPVWRMNWSIYPDAQLHYPQAKAERGDGFAGTVLPENTFIRIERQTLRRLPETGAILFTIRIHVDPLAALGDHENGGRLAAGLRQQLEELSGAQLDYKGFRPRREALVGVLAEIEERSTNPAPEPQARSLL